MNIRVGFGYDVHKLEEHHPFVLGGIPIPHHQGAVGHSDADTLIHAICDALLGAANLRDIGYHFSDKDPAFKHIDSKILLKKVVELLTEQHYRIGNIDTTICLQNPKIMNFIPEMKSVLCQVMEIPENDLSIKATTTEKLGFVGEEKGIAVYATVLIEKLP